jgi:hypothetical protein
MKSRTKLILFLPAILFFVLNEAIFAQCTNCEGSASNAQKVSSAIGDRTKASGFAAFASGSRVIASGDYSSSIGVRSQADGDLSFTLGSKIMAITKGSMILGHGYGESSSDRFFNRIPNSLMVGFNSIYPTLFVSPSESKFTTGKVGIGNVTNPQAKLHILSDPGREPGLFIEQQNFRQAEFLLGNTGHGIRSTDDHGLEFRTEKNYIFNEGAIGIGTNHPDYSLEVQGSTYTKQLTLFDGELYNDNIQGWVLRSDAEGKAYWTDPALFNDQDWSVKEDIIYRMEGRIGIGTSNPIAQLDLADIYEAGGLNLKIGNDAYLSDVDLEHTLGIYSQNNPDVGAIKLGNKGPSINGVNQNLGIGTRNPLTTLHINKDLTYGGTTGLCISNPNSYNWFIGMDGGQKHVKDLLIGNYDKVILGKPSYMVIKQDGNVGIGTGDTYGYKLAVNGAILTEEVTVKVSENWPDYVFKENYQLLSLHKLDSYIKHHGHLPEIPNESEIYSNGLKVGEMERLLLKKVEELTLYIIQQETRISALEGIIDEVAY